MGSLTDLPQDLGLGPVLPACGYVGQFGLVALPDGSCRCRYT